MAIRDQKRFFAALILMLVSFLVLAILSPFGCWVIPAHQSTRFIRLYAKPNILFFRVEGYHMCPLTAEGFFPPWESTARVRMTDRTDFLAMGKELYIYPTDFVIEGAEVIKGTLHVDRQKSEVTVSFEFDYGYGRLKAVNGTYSMKQVKPAIPLPIGVDP